MNLISSVNIISKYYSVKSITFNMVHSRVNMVFRGIICSLNGLSIIDIRSVINKSVISFSLTYYGFFTYFRFFQECINTILIGIITLRMYIFKFLN